MSTERPNCSPGCTCGRHKGVFCEPGCTCARHRMRRCEPGCTCGKHNGTPGYQTRHARVWEVRGKAADQQCCECGAQATHWAQIHDTDGLDPHKHYQPMCRSCHYTYDGVFEKLRAANVGRKFTEAQRAQRSEIARRVNAARTPEQRSENTRKGWETRRNRQKGA